METTSRAAGVFVGQAALRGHIERYARAFNLVEIDASPGRHPRQAGLEVWRRSVPESFVFSVVVPASLASLEPVADEPALIQHVLGVAKALRSPWWVLRTRPGVTPSARSLRGLAALIAKLASDGRGVAWEPRGAWSDEVARDAARSLGVHLVRDLAREDLLDGDPVVYTRLRALGDGARIGAAAAERVAERLAEASVAHVIVEGTGAGRVRQTLRDMLGLVQVGGEAGDEHGDLDEDEDEDEPGSSDEDQDEEAPESDG